MITSSGTCVTPMITEILEMGHAVSLISNMLAMGVKLKMIGIVCVWFWIKIVSRNE